ncbi:PSP1 domain-containing protein [Sedimentibacter saalensis]|jgi:cell fate regulator YaaT (PSP1 superfamily)|uniref:Cell fate regulator YaaT (PSP1 superfamily) n=1 Tax=Sedimentibacter saalensis TaxID=130788 RepID=A0A562J9M5_9FIRM|nr:stage 0 sporulation family protein [Sedimentibacter saalensis]MEA5095840.1 stage 0 sporulation family protein [Sedimentibacter saalensis]TWH79896.1 cell fate regulator YaaT (PSP1 superfamily) [Sedimentibacter saalensis]
MIKVVGVRFKKAGKIYYFDPDKKWINDGDFVIVETIRGIEFGQVVVGPKMVKEEDIVQPLKKVLRLATEEDIKCNQENKEKEQQAFDLCLKKIEEHQLEMKLVDIEYTFDNNKVIFYFTADGRIDFRELVKDLASIFRTRIELRQIGVRDEAKMIGGLGPCGRPMCCSSFLGEFYPVSIKMAKEQKLSLNPSKISGICSRLMCCLNYEHQVYEENIKLLPDVGDRVSIAGTKKTGIVLDINPLFKTARVNVTKTDGTVEIEEISGEDLKVVEEGVLKQKHEDINMAELRELED